MSTRAERGRWLAVLTVVLIAAGIAVGFAYVERTSGAVDVCLDRGGCWDYTRQACEFEDQCRCTPERCIVGPDGSLALPESQ